MSLKKKLLSGAAAIALIGSSSFAIDGACPAVQVEEDGTGDYLIAPVYYAIGSGESGWETKLKVVNTNTTNAVVAKVVVREALNSHEIIDFPIYLTPGDVWEGTIKDNGSRIIVESEDDSMIIIINGQIKKGAPGNPVVIGSGATSGTGVHDWTDPQGTVHKTMPWHGYVEIAGLAAYPASKIDPTWTVNTPLDKNKFFDAVRKKGGVYTQQLNCDVDGDNQQDAIDVSNDDLMGKAVLSNRATNAAAARHMSINLYALGNVSCEPVCNKDVIGKDTTPDQFSTKPVSTLLSEIDNALGKGHVYMMYEGDGQDINPIRMHFTNITKKYWYVNNTPLTSVGFDGPDSYLGQTVGSEPSTYYYVLNTGEPKPVIFRDMTEDTNYCHTQGDDVSGRPGDKCEQIEIHEEVHFFQERPTASVPYDAEKPIMQYAFPEGGYADFDLRNNIHTINEYCGVSLIPTSFVTKKFDLATGQELYIHNWLYNQYKKAEICESENNEG